MRSGAASGLLTSLSEGERRAVEQPCDVFKLTDWIISPFRQWIVSTWTYTPIQPAVTLTSLKMTAFLYRFFLCAVVFCIIFKEQLASELLCLQGFYT